MVCTARPCPSTDDDDDDDDDYGNDDDVDGDGHDGGDGGDITTGSLVSSSTLTRPRGRRNGKRTEMNPTAPTLHF